MPPSHRYYDTSFKEHVVAYYSRNHQSTTFDAVATLFDIRGGGRTVQRWFKRRHSLETRPRSGRPTILNAQQMNDHILTPIRRSNRTSTAARYTDLLPTVRARTGTNVSLSTIQRYGHNRLGIKKKKTSKRTVQECNSTHTISRSALFGCAHALSLISRCSFSLFAVTRDLCNEIAKIRRWAGRLQKQNLIYMDETHLKVNEAPRNTIVAPGEQSLVIVDDNTSYAARYDMITFISSTRVFPAVIFSPEERKARGVSGITSAMLLESIVEPIGPALGAYDRYPLRILCDKATIHNREKMMTSLTEGYCNEVVDIKFMPSKAAKRLSPLDNGLFHDWKERCRKHSPLTKANIKSVMITEWERTTADQLQTYYRHCGLTRVHDPYYDCPQPSLHRHTRQR